MKCPSRGIITSYLLMSIFGICDSSIFSSEQLQLPMINSLAAYTINWAGLITRAREIIERGGTPEQGIYNDGSRTLLRRVQLFEKRIRLTPLPDKYYFVLKKEFATSVELRFCEFEHSFIANNIKIDTIGSFLSPSIAAGIRIISLDHNNLYSFSEIQQKILVPCPNLKKLSVNYNKLRGILAISHETLEYFSATHNNFAFLEKFYLPHARIVNLSFNQLVYRHDTPQPVVSRDCKIFDVTNNPDLRIEIVDMYPDA